MSKVTSTFVCQECGHHSPKWMGRCPNCGTWNSLVEEIAVIPSKQSKLGLKQREVTKPIKLNEIDAAQRPRISTNDLEFNRVLGGGFVPGSLILIGGEPGIGKSTLLLQLAMMMQSRKVLYVSGEESDAQIKLRADRLASNNDEVYLYTDTELANVLAQVSAMEPDLVIIDSIQTMQSGGVDAAPGSVTQIRECATLLMKYAKESSVTMVLVGHITKEGGLAGPKLLEHMVDVVIQFEGDRHMSYRMLRTLKNRFGSTQELGIYEMVADGLRQVSNPSEILLTQREHEVPGVAISATMEGNRCLLVEVQSLVNVAIYGTPQRSATGFDNRRLNMLLAVLEKKGNYGLGNKDVFLNLTGGIFVEEPAIDLAVCASIMSSVRGVALPQNLCLAGEIGLGGEVRTVTKLDIRLAEANRLGFKHVVISKFGIKSLPDFPSLTIHKIGSLADFMALLQGNRFV